MILILAGLALIVLLGGFAAGYLLGTFAIMRMAAKLKAELLSALES